MLRYFNYSTVSKASGINNINGQDAILVHGKKKTQI